MSRLLSGQVVVGQIPQTISYQGLLTDADGNAVADDNYTISFKLYDVPTGGGSDLWEETQVVPVVGGIFNVILGSSNPLDDLDFDRPYWLGVTIGEDAELSPRIELTSAAYSLNARSVADSAVTGSKMQAVRWCAA